VLRVLSVPDLDSDCAVIRRGRAVLVLVSDRLLGVVAAAVVTRALTEALDDQPEERTA
jgi:ribosomal protein L36